MKKNTGILKKSSMLSKKDHAKVCKILQKPMGVPEVVLHAMDHVIGAYGEDAAQGVQAFMHLVSQLSEQRGIALNLMVVPPKEQQH